MGRLRLRLLVPLVTAAFLLSGCLDDLGEIFEIQAFSESDDAEVRKTGEALRKIREDREVQQSLDRFLETGDLQHLEAARAIRPDDTSIRGYDVVLATLDGDQKTIAAAKAALTLAEAKRLAAVDPEGTFGPVTGDHLRRNVLGEILVAQTNLLGGSLTEEWSAPGPDASPKTRQLYTDYCATRLRIQTEYDDSLSYIPLPPC